MADKRRAGLIQVKANGEIYDAKGEFTYNLGGVKREPIIGADGVHGYKEVPQVAYIEGEFTDSGDLSLETLINITDATVTINLNNRKTISLSEAWYAADGDVGTDEANIQVRFEAVRGEEIKA